MVQYKTEAIVLRSRRYREADALVTLLTKEKGKVTGVAKSVYKPTSKLRGGVQPYSVNDMLLSEGRSSLHTLIQSDCVDILLPIRQSYDAMALGAYWAELLEVFGQEEMADDELYLLGKAGFLGIALNPCDLTRLVLEIRLISQQGLRPDFEHCCRCGKPLGTGPATRFSSADGGFLCRSCEPGTGERVGVNPGVRGLWRGLEGLSLDKVSRLRLDPGQADDLGQVLRRWLARHTGKPLKTWGLIKGGIKL
jgi:DNA repair protein RecO (recombination protein O)